MDEVIEDATEAAEQHGIIFIDEIDKITGREMSSGPDALVKVYKGIYFP